MERAGALPLLPAFRARLGWEFVVPEAVMAELEVKRVPPGLEALLADGTARVGRCDANRTALPTELLEGMGKGEAGATCIVGECEDPTFRKYVILMDDRDARARARSFGIRSIDIRGFLPNANMEGPVSSGGAMAALESLEASGYRPRAGARDRFVRGLR